jgi:small subunit ribosomal protein S4
LARYLGPKCKLCRREGTKLFLKGNRCYSEKCAIERRSYAPGEHGQRRQKLSEYGVQLREKQKARRIYGILERQFRRYFDRAEREEGVTGDNLLQLLERRLDNVVYRLGFAASRSEARQVVRHGHITVDEGRVDIPSYLVDEREIVAVAEKSRSLPRIQENVEEARARDTVAWLSADYDKLQGTVLALPSREQIDVPVSEYMIVELYSR